MVRKVGGSQRGTTILRGGKANYKSSTLIGNWEEDREITPAPLYFERPGYETTKGSAELEGAHRQQSAFGNGVGTGSKHRASSIIHYQSESLTGPKQSITQSAYGEEKRVFQKQFGSKFPLQPAKVLARKELDQYRTVWCADKHKDKRFVTEHKECLNKGVPSKFKSQATRILPNVPVVIQDLQQAIIDRNGVHGLHVLAKTFRLFDVDRSGTLSRSELERLLSDFGLKYNIDDFRVIWTYFDKDNSGSISYDEFVQGLQGPLSSTREALVEEAWSALQERAQNGVVTLNDLLDNFCLANVRNPTPISEKVVKQFARQWDAFDDDEPLAFQDFLQYYHRLSPAVLDDQEFAYIVKGSWGF